MLKRKQEHNHLKKIIKKNVWRRFCYDVFEGLRFGVKPLNEIK